SVDLRCSAHALEIDLNGRLHDPPPSAIRRKASVRHEAAGRTCREKVSGHGDLNRSRVPLHRGDGSRACSPPGQRRACDRCLGETSDEEIARRAPNILKWYAMVPQDAVQVTVQKGRATPTGDVIWQYVSAYLLAASRCNRPGSQLNVRVQADFRFVPIQLAEGRPLAEQLGNSVHVTVSTICRISFVCTQARIETE